MSKTQKSKTLEEIRREYILGVNRASMEEHIFADTDQAAQPETEVIAIDGSEVSHLPVEGVQDTGRIATGQVIELSRSGEQTQQRPPAVAQL